MAERNTQWRDGAMPDLPVAATTKIEAGKMVGINSSGYAVEVLRAALSTKEGETVIMNTMRDNSTTVKQIAGGA